MTDVRKMFVLVALRDCFESPKGVESNGFLMYIGLYRYNCDTYLLV